MAIAKTHEFALKEKILSDFSKSLSHPARLSILKVLAKKQVCICGDLIPDLGGLAQATVSQHLKALKDAELIVSKADGTRSVYCINWKKFNQFKKLMNDFNERISQFEIDSKC